MTDENKLGHGASPDSANAMNKNEKANGTTPTLAIDATCADNGPRPHCHAALVPFPPFGLIVSNQSTIA